MRFSTIAGLTCVLGCVIAVGASAESLRVGLAAEPTAIDPHHHRITPNAALAAHIFESLVEMDADMRLIPRLAESWEATDDLTWEFKLRPNVKFSNGEPFTSKDVMFTLCRVQNNKTAIAGYGSTARRIVRVETPDATTIRLITATPYPLLVNEMASMPIIWSGIAKSDKLTYDPAAACSVPNWPTVEDFNSGYAAIGTGPYLLKSFVKDSGIKLRRNDAYWGQKPYWDTVSLVAVPASDSRSTGLLAGDFDLVESPPVRDLTRLKSRGFDVEIKPSVRVMFLQLDVGRVQSPQVRSAQGNNPLQDVRVRQAMSMAIDRQAIVERVMDGVATPAYQFLPDGMFGALRQAPELKYDPQRAKALLAAAGYPNGFELTLASSNDRYINDAQIVQALAQYFARIGIKADVETMTQAVFFSRRAKRDFSAALSGWGTGTGEASNFFLHYAASFNPATGQGLNNYGVYSNVQLDRTFADALRTLDNVERVELLNQVITIALEDMPNIPLHYESSIWAFRKGYRYEGRADQRTLAMSFRPAK